MDKDNQEFVELNPWEIQIPSGYGRKKECRNRIAELAQSMSLHGLLHPLVVQRDKNCGFLLVAGARRLQAAKEADFQKVSCLVKTGCSGLTSLAENLHREDLDPIDKANAYHSSICEMGVTQKAFAQKIGKSEASISATLSLRNLRPEIIDRHQHDGVLSERQLLQIHKLGTLESQERAYERALAGNSGAGRKQASIQDVIARKTDSLTKTVEKIDPAKLNANEMADTFIRIFSAVEHLAASSARMPNFDLMAKAEIVKAGSLSLQQTIERIGLSDMSENDSKKIVDRLLSILTTILESHGNKIHHDISETAAVLRNVAFVLAQHCVDAESLRAFCAAIREIERSIRKSYSARFSAMNFLRKIVGWI